MNFSFQVTGCMSDFYAMNDCSASGQVHELFSIRDIVYTVANHASLIQLSCNVFDTKIYNV